MENKSRGLYPHYFLLTLAVVLAVTCVGAVVSAQEENVGQTRQAIVSGSPVSLETQEELGLLSLAKDGFNPSCSAALLTNEWAITAAHCLDDSDLSDPSQISLTAAWGGSQTRQAREIRSFGPTPDIALIRAANPFRVNGGFTGYRRELAREEDYYGLRTYGRGVNVLASGSGASAVPAQSDGQYRFASVAISKLERNLYWFPRNRRGQIVAGGDSGGPSFANVWGRTVLAGVHATCRVICLPGQTCSGSGWMWISAIEECADAPVWSALDRITQAINEPSVSSAKTSPGPLGGVPHVEGKVSEGLKGGRFDTSATPPGVISYIYTVRDDGNLEWRRHDGAAQGLPLWQGAVPVGGGWGDFKHVFHGGGNVIYAVNREGDLIWFRHNTAYSTGTENTGSPRPMKALGKRKRTPLAGPRVVGSGWQNFRHVFSAGDGVIYAVAEDGRLLWYKHKSYMEPAEMPSGADSGMADATSRLNWVRSWESVEPRVVGAGWGDFRHVFPGGDGIIYVVTQDGKLQRYRHVAYLEGRGAQSPGAWEGPVEISRGWGDFQQFFSRGDGIIYMVSAGGELFWYKDVVPRKGMTTDAVTAGRTLGKRRLRPQKVDDGWGGFLKVFALLPVSAPDAVR